MSPQPEGEHVLVDVQRTHIYDRDPKTKTERLVQVIPQFEFTMGPNSGRIFVRNGRFYNLQNEPFDCSSIPGGREAVIAFLRSKSPDKVLETYGLTFTRKGEEKEPPDLRQGGLLTRQRTRTFEPRMCPVTGRLIEGKRWMNYVMEMRKKGHEGKRYPKFPDLGEVAEAPAVKPLAAGLGAADLAAGLGAADTPILDPVARRGPGRPRNDEVIARA